MRAASEKPVHVSKNRLEGSLADTRLEQLLEPCHRHLLTGTIKVRSEAGKGLIILRAGAVDQARFGDLIGDAAVARMCALDEGSYELAQRLPELGGALGSAAELEGEVEGVPIAKIMRHCEDNALSCTLTLVNGFDRGEIVYRAGEIVDITMNGKHDEDAIVAICAWKGARFRASAPPLDHDIGGWPRVTREPTAPFKIDHLRAGQAVGQAEPAAAAVPAAPPVEREAESRWPGIVAALLLPVGLALIAAALFY